MPRFIKLTCHDTTANLYFDADLIGVFSRPTGMAFTNIIVKRTVTGPDGRVALASWKVTESEEAILGLIEAAEAGPFGRPN